MREVRNYLSEFILRMAGFEAAEKEAVWQRKIFDYFRL